MFLESCSNMAGSCCERMTDRGISSLWVLTVKCHDFILMRSSNVNSKYNRPSVHTWKNASYSYHKQTPVNNIQYLCVQRFSMMRYHRALFAFQWNTGIVEGLFSVLHIIVQFCYSSFKYTSEVPRYQRSSDCCTKITQW